MDGFDLPIEKVAEALGGKGAEGEEKDDSSLNNEQEGEQQSKPEGSQEAQESPEGETEQKPKSESGQEGSEKTSEEGAEKPTDEKVEDSEQNPVEDTGQPKEEVSSFKNINEVYDYVDDKLYEEHGITLDDYYDIDDVDYDDMAENDEVGLITEWMYLENENINDKIIDAELSKFDPLFVSDEERQEMIDNDEITERELDKLDAEFERMKLKALSDMKSMQDSLPNIDDIEFGTGQAATADQPNKEYIEQLTNKVRDNIGKYDKETFEIKDANGEVVGRINYELNQDDKSAVEGSMVNGLMSRYVDDSGNVDFGKWQQDMLVVNNLDKILNLAWQEASAKAERGTVDKINNKDLSLGSEPTGNETQKTSGFERMLRSSRFGD